MASDTNQPDFSGLTESEIYDVLRIQIGELPAERRSLLLGEMIDAVAQDELKNLITFDHHENQSGRQKSKPR